VSTYVKNQELLDGGVEGIHRDLSERGRRCRSIGGVGAGVTGLGSRHDWIGAACCCREFQVPLSCHPLSSPHSESAPLRCVAPGVVGTRSSCPFSACVALLHCTSVPRARPQLRARHPASAKSMPNPPRRCLWTPHP